MEVVELHLPVETGILKSLEASEKEVGVQKVMDVELDAIVQNRRKTLGRVRSKTIEKKTSEIFVVPKSKTR